MDQIEAQRKLVAKGAEAELFLEKTWLGREVLLKKRVEKRYRISSLDRAIREYRTMHEAEIMHKAKKIGVSTPVVFLVDLPSTTIFMEHVCGQLIRNILGNLSEESRLTLFHTIGAETGKLHKGGIIHGDLTTSNMILTENDRICFLDFGLAEHSDETEKRGVDLHLMKRMLVSTHYMFADECFASFLQGYSDTMGIGPAKEVVKKAEEIERRGRYVSEREISEDDNKQSPQVQ